MLEKISVIKRQLNKHEKKANVEKEIFFITLIWNLCLTNKTGSYLLRLVKNVLIKIKMARFGHFYFANW